MRVLLLVLAAAMVTGEPVQTSTPIATAASSPTPAVTVPLTLTDALSRARATSPLRAAAQQRLDAAASATRLMPRSPNPVFEVRAENWGAGTPQTNPRDIYVTAAQTVELGGKYGARRREAIAAAGLARAEVGTAEWNLTGAVAERYVAAVRARDLRAVLAEQRDGLAETVRILTARLREGTGAEADLRRFESEQTRLDHAMVRMSIALDQELGGLSALIGTAVSADQLVTPATPEVPPAPPLVTATLVAQRPDLRAARAQVQRLEAQTGIERAAATPDLTLNGGYKRTNNFHTGVAAVSVAVPLFNRNAADIARAQGDVQAARFDAVYLEQQALAEATSRWAAAQQLAARAAAVETTLLTPATVARTAARSAFAESAGDILRLVDAERLYMEAAREAVELRLDAILALMQARIAIGEEPLP
jgi:cobalt-zinc-cadmium efflux system outer membrane protein